MSLEDDVARLERGVNLRDVLTRQLSRAEALIQDRADRLLWLVSVGQGGPLHGAGYTTRWNAWVKREGGWPEDFDNKTRMDAIWCHEHRTELEELRSNFGSTWAEKRNHPSTMRRIYEARSKSPTGQAERMSPKAKYEAQIAELRDWVEERDQTIASLKSGGTDFEQPRDLQLASRAAAPASPVLEEALIDLDRASDAAILASMRARWSPERWEGFARAVMKASTSGRRLSEEALDAATARAVKTAAKASSKAVKAKRAKTPAP